LPKPVLLAQGSQLHARDDANDRKRAAVTRPCLQPHNPADRIRVRPVPIRELVVDDDNPIGVRAILLTE
jgi:hypothetical protein